jgi:hypothetical protein
LQNAHCPSNDQRLVDDRRRLIGRRLLDERRRLIGRRLLNDRRRLIGRRLLDDRRRLIGRRLLNDRRWLIGPNRRLRSRWTVALKIHAPRIAHRHPPRRIQIGETTTTHEAKYPFRSPSRADDGAL